MFGGDPDNIQQQLLKEKLRSEPMSARKRPSPPTSRDVYTDDYHKLAQKDPGIALIITPFLWAGKQASYLASCLSVGFQDLTDPRSNGSKAVRKVWGEKTKAQRFLDFAGLAFLSFGINTTTVQLANFRSVDPATVAFLPHPGVSGYDVGRLVPPVGYVAQSAYNFVMPDSWGLDADYFKVRSNVYGEWDFYLALALVTTIQLLEAMAIRSVSLDTKRKKFNEINSQEKAVAAPDAIRAARMEAAKVNTHGLGGYGLIGFFVLMVYAVEVTLFCLSVRGASTNLSLLIIIGLAEVFGAEFSWALSERIDER